MSQLSITEAITKKTKELNECITEWYRKNFPDDIVDFKGCCDEDEIKLLIKCYNIFSKKYNLQVLDNDVIKALLMYYYIVVVFENYVHHFIDKKYLKIVNEEKSDDVRKPPNLYFFTDNDDNIYTHYRTKYDDIDPYSEIENPFNNEELYIRSNKDNLRKTDPYIYKDDKLKKKVITENYMNCLENMLTTDKSKKYYELLYMGSEDWISEIRGLILNMNTELFEGHKGGKNYEKKNTKKKRNLKKVGRIKGKSRKNKGKKRVNKIKYTKK